MSDKYFASPLEEEIEWYLSSRGIEGRLKPPLWRTPNPPEEVDGQPVRFNPAAVDRVIRTIGCLKHTKGRWAGKPLELAATQIAYIIAPLFGWQVWNELAERWIRLRRETFIEMPRKGAKSTLASAIAMTMAFGDGEGGAEVIIGAASRDQAKACFQPLHDLATYSPLLQKAGVKTVTNEIRQPKTSSVIKVVSSRGELAHGTNPHASICDELHVHKDGVLLEALESGSGARIQPLSMIITTADEGRIHTPYDKRRSMIEGVARGDFKAPRMYGAVWAAPDDADIYDEAVWDAANPLYPETPSPDFMRAQADKARANAADRATFKRLHLGIRANQKESFINIKDWDKCAGKGDWTPDDMVGSVVYGGMDLAAVSDLCALMYTCPMEDGTSRVWGHYWLPEAALDRLDHMTELAATDWVRQGWITVTPGNVTDYDFIRKHINDDAEKYRISSIGFDPWNSTHLTNQLAEDGLTMEKVRQGAVTLSSPTKELKRKVLSDPPLIDHRGDPVLRWMISCLVPHVDASGNVKPDKVRSRGKIDGVSALVTSIYVQMVYTELSSSYETGGVEAI
nr:MAG TPA: Large Terminase [Caudoviricetes sp.]